MSSEHLILNFLSHDAFIQINKRVLQILNGDAHATIILGELVSLYTYFKKKGEAKDGWFFQTVLDVEDSLKMSEHIQRKAINALRDIGFLKLTRRGSPPKRFFFLDFDQMARVLISDKPLQKIPRISVPDKKEFYDKINESIYASIDQFRSAKDNIREDIAQFMLAWSRLYRRNNSKEWKWDSKSFGQLNNYWRQVYGTRKAFDFKRLVDYLETYPTVTDIPSFIHFDRGKLDSIVDQMSMKDLVSKYEIYFKDTEETNGEKKD